MSWKTPADAVKAYNDHFGECATLVGTDHAWPYLVISINGKPFVEMLRAVQNGGAGE